MQEKRRAARLQESFIVRHRALEEKSVEQTQANNISIGGMLLETDTSFEIGRKLNMEVNVPRSLEPYYVQGEVVWLQEAKAGAEKKFDMGIRFLRIIPKKDLDLI